MKIQDSPVVTSYKAFEDCSVSTNLLPHINRQSRARVSSVTLNHLHYDTHKLRRLQRPDSLFSAQARPSDLLRQCGWEPGPRKCGQGVCSPYQFFHLPHNTSVSMPPTFSIHGSISFASEPLLVQQLLQVNIKPASHWSLAIESERALTRLCT